MYFPIKDTDLDRRRKLTKAQRTIVKYLYKHGKKIKEIASKMGVSYSTIYLLVCSENQRKGILKSKNEYKLKWWGELKPEERKDLSHKYYTVHKKYKSTLYQAKIDFKGKEK